MARNQKTYSDEAKNEIKKAYKKCKSIKEQKRILSIKLRVIKGMPTKEISSITELSTSFINTLISQYNTYGLEKLELKQQGGNHRNFSKQEEKELLQDFKKQAENGQLLEVSTIQKAYEEKHGKEVPKSTVYKLLARHEWRKLMPRSKHPKKASDEAIAAYKKNR